MALTFPISSATPKSQTHLGAEMGEIYSTDGQAGALRHGRGKEPRAAAQEKHQSQHPAPREPLALHQWP